MHPIIQAKQSEISALCRRYRIRTLDVFGSAARGDDFDPHTSDVDFLVEFDQDSDVPPLEEFFGLRDALAGLLGRSVDLVEVGTMRNPYVLTSIERSRERVYGA